VQDAIAGFQAAPLWARVAMVAFAVMAVVAVFGPSFRHRRFRRRFDALAQELGQQPPAGRGWPVLFPISGDGRAFEIRHDFRSRGKRSSYRGPTGYLLLIATRLAGTKWQMQQVDLTRLEGRLARLLTRTRLTGDSDFDARCVVVEDGVPVRDGWLDAATRQEVARFLSMAPAPGIVWIREGELLCIAEDPWAGVDGPFIRALLGRQAALAAALERTADGSPK